jgi:hypothetical protein
MNAEKRKKFRLAAHLLLAGTIIAGAVILDGVAERYYFYSNWIKLQNAAYSATIAGSTYLPSHPRRALAVAREYAELNGVRANEIVTARVAHGNRTIILKVKRAIPFYLDGAVVGATTRSISATAASPPPPPQSMPARRGIQA